MAWQGVAWRSMTRWEGRMIEEPEESAKLKGPSKRPRCQSEQGPEDGRERHGMVWRDMAWHGMARHGAARQEGDLRNPTNPRSPKRPHKTPQRRRSEWARRKLWRGKAWKTWRGMANMTWRMEIRGNRRTREIREAQTTVNTPAVPVRAGSQTKSWHGMASGRRGVARGERHGEAWRT